MWSPDAGLTSNLEKRAVRFVNISRLSNLLLLCAIEFCVEGRDVAVAMGVREDIISLAINGFSSCGIDGGGSGDCREIEWVN